MSHEQHEFTVVDSELLLETPILAMRRDRIVMPGGTVAPREVVEHFGAVAIAAVDEHNRLAMIRQYRHSVAQRLLELPAGLLDIADEDPLIGAKRELHEEAGIKAQDWMVIADVLNSPGYCDEVCRVYLATGLTNVGRPAESDDDEEADLSFEWVDLAEARRMVVAGEILNSITISGVFAASEVMSGRVQGRPADCSFDLRPTALPNRRKQAGICPDMKKL
ncbi:NUDIX domain-containing protein [Corynebacterium uterequi]|uniref:NTP pyrophosphohydrolase n=1 Tax=Corynebacterium uterequi TaxID=1072256 RepID=A0A0G3HGG5_9CORY|nr:NUDIX hydrolase [Corynebacterium uterequi]AKK11038.1 NTP pyrophosphohydrolase [Corynebacterium uterequi]